MFTKSYSSFAGNWGLDKSILFLNHGSFGAAPLKIIEKQNEYRMQMESEPLRFFIRELDELLENVRSVLADFIIADRDDLVFVLNATAGVNTVLRSIKFKKGENILITDQIYPACRNAVNFIAKQNGLNVIEVKTDLPIKNVFDFVDKIISSSDSKTRLALIDHISSLPGILFPIEYIVKEFERKGIDTLVDGAHCPGMIPLDINKIGAAYFTGNCHKWLLTPKGSAFLTVRKDKKKEIYPLIISRLSEEEDFQLRFSWQGTQDPTAILCIPAAIDFVNNIYDNGWEEHMERNHKLAYNAAKLLCNELEIELPYPEEMCGSIYGIPFGEEKILPKQKVNVRSYIQDILFKKYNIEVMISFWDKFPKRTLRISAQAYNTFEQYQILVDCLKKELK